MLTKTMKAPTISEFIAVLLEAQTRAAGDAVVVVHGCESVRIKISHVDRVLIVGDNSVDDIDWEES